MTTFDDFHECAHTKMVVGQSANGKLMSVVNGAGLVLDGIVFSPPNPRVAIVHVHGSLGNFYQQPFIRVFANRLARHGIAVLSFNLTCHDGVSEGYTSDQKMQYIGGSLSRFETCLDDLDALLCFAGSICPRVVLQGHSLGCDRVLFYVQQRATRIPLILLSPCDSRRLQEIWLADETISEQAARLSAESDDDAQVNLVPASEYGLAGPDDWTYSIPICRDALLSIITGPPFGILRVNRSAETVSNAPAFVYMGADDSIRGATLNEMSMHVRRLVPSALVFTVEHGDHSLDGCEDEVADSISEWAYRVGLLSESSTSGSLHGEEGSTGTNEERASE